MGLFKRIKQRKQSQKANTNHKVPFMLEMLEPRLLLSADFSPQAALAMSGGLSQFGDRIDEVLTAEDLFDTQLPFIVQVEREGEDVQNVAPTLGTLFSVEVDTNGDGSVAGNESSLEDLDIIDIDGTVDAGEFIQGWFFDQIMVQLDGYSGTTTAFANWLDDLEETLTLAKPDGSAVTTTLEVTNAADLTETVPIADLMFDVDFELTVSQSLPIDLGTEADALKLLYYTGSYENKVSPMITVDSTLTFGFIFGVRIGGQESPGEILEADDFFVRTADDLHISAEASDSDVDFKLNIGFLGAEVVNGDIDFQATVNTLLIDPDAPDVLGFTTDQYGVEQTGGVVTGFDVIPSEDLTHDAGFVLRIGNAGIATQVDVISDENDNFDDLVDDVNAALDTASLGDLVEASLDGSDHLVFTLIATTDTPLGFPNESYNETGVLSADPGAFEFTSDISFLLSVDGALPKLVTVSFPDTAQTELGFDDSQTAILPDLVGQNNANATGTIGGDGTATFNVKVTQSDGTVTGPVAVNVTEALYSPDPNTSLTELNSDLIIALANAGLNSLILSEVQGDKIALYAFDPTVSAIEITAADADTETQSFIGFVAGQRSTLALTAINTPISSFDLTEDAHLKLTIATSDGPANVEVTIPADLNADAAALAEDINTAIDQALDAEGLGNKINVEVDPSGKIVLKATDSTVWSFSISTINTTIEDLVDDVNRALEAASFSGLVEASAVDSDTLQLATTGGETLEITKTLTLDAGVTYAELVDTPTEDLFAPEIDEGNSNISFELPVSILQTPADLNYDPPNVAMVGNFSPFGRILIDPPTSPIVPVARIGEDDTRFDLNFTYTPTIDDQDLPVGSVPDSSILTEEFRLVNMAESLNFNLVTAESMVGLIMGLGTALQQIADSGLFATYDIPFADAALSELLNFSDPDPVAFSGLIDTSLIYDTDGNGVDETLSGTDEDKLLKLIQVGTGDDAEFYLIPDFVTAQEMADTLSSILDVAVTGTGGINANYNPLYTLSAAIGAVSDGILSGDAIFEISIDTGGGLTPTSITVAADDTNTNVADLAADIDAQLTVEGLPIEAVAVNGMIHLRAVDASVLAFIITSANSVAQNEVGLIPNREATRNELTYQVELISSDRTNEKVTYEVDDPVPVLFEYDVDLSPFAKLTVDTTAALEEQAVALQGYTGLTMTFGIDLKPPGTVIYPETELDDLNGDAGVDIKTERAVTGEEGVRTLYALSYDAHFELEIDGSEPIPVVIAAEDTTTNESIGELITDISFALTDALAGTGHEGKVVAGYDVENPSRLKLYATGGSTFQFLASNTDPAVLELGFPSSSAVASSVTARREPMKYVGRITDDATFKIDILGDGYDPYLVTVPASATAGNRTIRDLVADVNNALAVTKIGEEVFDISELIKADYDISATHGPRLVLTATDDATQFSVSEADLFISVIQLGLPTGTTFANQYDFVIFDRVGGQHNIVLDSLIGDTVQELIDHINVETGGAVEADYNATKTGLQLRDDTGSTDHDFRVETVNGSGALLTLGLFRTDNTGTEHEEDYGNPRLIEGGQIGLTHLDDRFFVRDAELWGAIGLQTPSGGVPGSALFGIVGVDTYLSGTQYAEFTADIKDPDTGIAGDTATLLQLFEGAKQGRLTDDATFTIDIVHDVPGPYTLTIYKSDTLDDPVTEDVNEANNTLEDLVALINEALEAEFLDDQIVAQASGTRIEFVSLIEDDPETEFINEAEFTINASGTAITELGLPDPETSSTPDEDGIHTFTARSASRYAVAEPVVSKVSELDYEQGFFDDDFKRGAVLVGQTSGATAIILDVDEFFDTGTLTLFHVDGTFQDEEDIEDSLGGVGEAVGTATQYADFGEFNLHVDVQDGFAMEIDAVPTGFGASFGLLNGMFYDVGFTLTDFGNPYDPTEPVASFVDLAADTGDLYAFNDLDYADIGVALEDLLGVLEAVDDAEFEPLSEEIPAIGKSFSELLSLVDGFARGVDNVDEAFDLANLALEDIVDMPALRLQDIPRALRGAFGLPDGVDPDGVDPDDGLPNVDWVKLDFDKGDNELDPADDMLLVDMSLNESISTKLGLDIEVGSGLPNLTSGGVLIVEGNLDVNLSFGINLAAPNEAFLFDDSSIAGSLDVVGEGQQYAGDHDGMGMVFRASLGALSVFIQDADALIDLAFELPGLDFSGELVPGQKPISQVVWGDWIKPDPVASPDVVDIVLPMFYGGEGPNDYVDDFKASGSFDEGLTVTVPDFSSILYDIENEIVEYDPFENILLAIDTLNLYLEGLSDILAGDVLGIKLPFVGDQMADILFIESFRHTLYSTLKNGVENDIDPTPEEVTTLLETALGSYLDGGVDYHYLMEGDVETWYRQWDFTLAGTKNITLSDFDLGIPNLGFDVDVPVDVELEWVLDLGFGVNFAEVAYIDVTSSNELDLDLEVTLPSLLSEPPDPLEASDANGRFGFLLLNVTDPDNDTGAILNFDVNVKNGDTTENHLGFSDLGSIKPVAELQGTPFSDDQAVTLHLMTKAIYGLPELRADLIIDWALPEHTAVASLNGNAVTPDIPGIGVDYIALLNMEFLSGSVASSLIEPLFGEIIHYIEPFMPVVDTLTAPIPILSDLAGEPFTLLDLAAIFGDVNPEFIDAVADILDVISTISAAYNAPLLPLGDLVLYDITDANLANHIKNFDPTDPDSKLSEIDLTSLSTDDDGDGLTVPLGEGAAGDYFDYNYNNDFLNKIRPGPLVEGLSMPIFNKPRQAIGLFLNQNAVMLDYQLPPLSVEFEYLQVFPVWGPLAVSIEISFGFTVDLHSVGFDTYGYQRYANGGFRNPKVMFDGFYLNDLNAEGVDAPEVFFEFGLVGAAELNLGIARAGVGGGIKATIYMDWFDPIPDGRVHISELLGNVMSADPGPNPLAVFDLGGALTFQLFAFLEINFGFFTFEEDFPITPETELFSFEYTFDHDPILATDIGSGVLQLNMGPNAEDRLYGDTSDGHEEITLDWVSGNTVQVTSTKFGVSTAQVHEGITHIVGIGRQGNDEITLNLGTSGITYELEGGIGDDKITVNGGTGDGVIRGGLGNDTLKGGDGDDIIYGELGNDAIDGRGGFDTLFGDQGRVFDLVTDPDPLITSRVRSSDGDDTINGGADDDIIIGAGGNDTLNGNEGNDVIIGDGGRFAYEEIGGHFEIIAITGTDLWRDPDKPAEFVHPYVPELVDTDDPTDPAVISEDIDKIYDAMMATFSSTDLGFGGNDTISGGANDDIILSGSGDDVINGDADADIIIGGKGFDEIYGGSGNDTIFGGDQADTISGNENDDVISGGAGNDYIHGNTGDDVMKGDSGADVMFGDEHNDQVFGQTEPDILFGGVNDDLVVGGTSNDIMFGDDGVVAKLNPDYVPGSDPVSVIGYKVIFNDTLIDRTIHVDPLLASVQTQEGDSWWDDDKRSLDLIVTYVVPGDGDDFLSGNAGDDFMFGGGGNDTMGGDVDPRLPDAGEDTEISEDVMIGDGGMITFDQRQFRSIATIIEPIVGTEFDDTIYGDNGNDYILGGWENDFLFGGHGKVVDISLGIDGVGAFRGPTDTEASDNDIIISDNGEILFAGYSATYPQNFGVKELIRTTDELDTTGGHDYAEGELGNDIIFGGVNGSEDVLFGNVGDDVILGDNGLIHFNYDWASDPDKTDDDYSYTDDNLDTLDLIRSYRDGLGGTDIISGKQGDDVLIGGTGGDFMYGDDDTASSGANDGEDIMLGDNGDIFLSGTVGRLTVQVAEMTTGTAVDLITTTDAIDADHATKAAAEACGGPDTMSGNAGNDIMLGGVNNDDAAGDPEVDRLYGDRGGLNPEDQPTPASILNDGDDILLGDNGLLDFTYLSDTDQNTLDLIQSFEDGLGGIDIISGNKGLDVAIGGTDDDTIYGDDASANAADADLADLLMGDNADIFLLAVDGATGIDLKTVLDAAVYLIRTTDEEHPEYGGRDTISGNADNDIIAGGVYGDTIYGDREVPNTTTEEDEGDDIILGDNGAFEWLSTGRLGEITGIDIQANNEDLYNWFTTMFPGGDEDLGTLDLVTTEQPTSGGRDLIYGDQGRDLVFAGTDADTIYGDDGDETGDSANNDLLFGDHGRIYPQFSTLRGEEPDWRLAFNSRNFFAIDIGDVDGGEGDRMWGEEGDDTMVGQQGDDRMWGGGDDDDMTGGHNVASGYDELTGPAIEADLNPVIGVPAIDAVNDLMDGGSGDDAMAGDNTIIWRRGDDLSPRFRELTEDAIYTTTFDSITANIGGDWQSDPDDAIGRDIELVDHSDAVQADPQGRFGADVMAGGADSDVMFGELANDLMQGDGAIETSPVGTPFLSYQIDVVDSGFIPPDPDTTETLHFNIPELATDADDYMEGSGGDDLMYGGLGQDDMIGGSSELFGLYDPDPAIAETLRPDGSDVIFGGVGIAIARNDIGATETEALASEHSETHVITTESTGHARDADFIMGDNANVYRLVVGGADGTDPDDPDDLFLTFNYDNYGPLHIIPRAMEQLDYTLGGADYAKGVNPLAEYVDGAADLDGDLGPMAADNGAADLIHGESGDDIIFGMTGSDLIFGEGQDDDIIGGYGHDWISGGTGQDGVLGDDGLILTSRNHDDYGEPLYSIDPLVNEYSPRYANGDVLDETIKTPGEIQYAVINLEDQLKKTADLVPFSFDPDWLANDDEFPDNQDTTPYADDIIFGGLGTDWLHGGSGDDAISGAEALPEAYVPVYNQSGDPIDILDLGYDAVALPSPVNPGDVLAFNPVDLDGRHLNNRFRAGEFFLYDEYDPLRKIQLNSDGELWKPGDGGTPYEFLLNFDETEGVVRIEGVVPKATGQQTETYPQVNDDGKDAIFGDLGNDWLVGGTGRDNIYGGWGNDLLNADDDQTTPGDEPKHGGPLVDGANDVPDTHPYYEDRAYGGAGRDVLIGNTGGDRLIDWVGEYNSYLVPYAPFGMASVSRTMQPFLQEFLYALSAGDGADLTRYSDAIGGDEPVPTKNNPIPSRNGEPHGELGLVLQKDFAWQAQTGAPADPQAGNIPGGHRDVLRSATFHDEMTQGFMVESGTWTVSAGSYNVKPTLLGTDAISLWHHDQVLPSYFELTAMVRPVKPIAGYKANAYIVFDYYSDEDFKFAGLDSSNNKIVIGQHTVDGWEVLNFANMQIKDGMDYNLLLVLNGTTATIVVNNSLTLTYGFAPRLDFYGLPHNFNDGMIGLGTDNAKASTKSMTIQVLPPVITSTATDEFDADPELVVGESGTWTLLDGYFVGEPENGQTLALAIGELTVGPAYLLQLETTLSTETTAGVVFDQYDVDDFKWVAYSKATSQVMIGHYTARDGWVTDNAISYNANGEATLKVTLKGSTVSVMIDDQPAVSHVFNAIVTDGKFGLLAKDSSASFDTFTVRTDDPSFAVEAETDDLMAAAAPGDTSGETITDADLAPIVAEAIDRLAGTLLLDESALALLHEINFEIVDLGGMNLGQATDTIVLIDDDAAGFGWFVDPTPFDDTEFRQENADGELLAKHSSLAYGDMDLLTVVMHELGHVLGYEDVDPGTADLMSATLDASTRRLNIENINVSSVDTTVSTYLEMNRKLSPELFSGLLDLLQSKRLPIQHDAG